METPFIQSKTSRSRINERIENVLAGLMFFGWAILRMTSAETEDRWTLPQMTPAVVHLVVGSLFLFRSPTLMRADWVTLAWCLPSFIAGGTAMTIAPASHLWPDVSQALFVIGGIGAVVGMLFLGKSFAVFPAVRKVVVTGPYRLIRHPIYFFELVMIAGACLTVGSGIHWLLLAFAIATIVIRIYWEEKVLSTSPRYRAFAKTVRWRLFPGIW